MTESPGLLSMAAISYFMHGVTPSNMNSKFLRHSAAGISAIGAGVAAIPAALTAPSRPRNSSAANSTIASIGYSLLTSVAMNCARSPLTLKAAATFLPRA
jgi:hypothetical protein